MAINSSRLNQLATKGLTRSEIVNLIEAGMSSGVLKEGILDGKNYSQLLQLTNLGILGYLTNFPGSTVQNAIESISQTSIQTYASANNFTIESYQGNTYLRRDFTSSGSSNYSPPSILQNYTCSALVVAGGGGGASQHAGAGGAGGVVFNTSFSIGSSIAYTVGGGGTGMVANTGSSNHTNGQDSILGSLTAIGGGRGGMWPGVNTISGQNGGSGGGGGSHSSTTAAGSGLQPASQSGGYGNNGGSGETDNSSPHYGGGGGGAGGAGGSTGGSGSQGGNGGVGISIFGIMYGGGGGGGAYSGTPGNGGSGGGGVGGRGASSNTEAGNGVANTGGGGGGAGQYEYKGGNGGSGVIIVRYNLSQTL
jgi:hypothetical protein